MSPHTTTPAVHPTAGAGGRAARDEGQVAFVLVAFMVALFIGGTYIVRFGADQQVGAQSRTTADAAALAGADIARESILDRILGGNIDLTGFGSALGSTAARDYAERNGGTLEDYDYNPFTGRVEVTVRVPFGDGSGSRTQQSAAALAFSPAGLCHEETPPPPTPTPTPTPDPDDTETPTPTPPPPDPILVCSVPGLGEFELPPGAGLIGDLRRAMEPRLVP